MKAWDVILNDEVIDTVFYDDDCDAEYVKDGLINHDGYDPGIEVRCEEDEPKTMQYFIKSNKITITNEWVERNPNMTDFEGNHYKVTLMHGRKKMTLYFSQGFGIKGEPDAANVLDCLASDALSVDSVDSYEAWAYEMGYDEDIRKAEKTYKACVRQTANLKKFLGNELYEELLYNTER